MIMPELMGGPTPTGLPGGDCSFLLNIGPPTADDRSSQRNDDVDDFAY